MAFSPDGKQIVSGSNNYTVCLCSENAMQPWSFHHGWIYSGSSNLLVWIPTYNRIGLWTPSTKLVIGAQQTKIQFHNCGHGEEWKNCYIHH
ncbi:hypothetical protein DFH08DRAFT_888524 [Mycena albidolilacea]|uniref:Uncharacterized protein n=1 Tax=Mycena albidolilacea TaxID=1033008 RepID=A0AAD6ZHF4_9AGAR|nr:hypothetical protein DFH08DRAFT_888524 [Mycena albidolilacea]